MNIFLSAERRRIHRYIDNTIENTLAVMALDGFREELGGDVFDNHKRVIEDLFIPNVRHGQIILPQSVRSKESIPIAGFEPGQELLYGADAVPTPFQKYRQALKIQSWTGRTSLSRILQEVEYDDYAFGDAIIAPEAKVVAAVENPVSKLHVPNENIGDDRQLALLGRPLVVMAMDGGDHQYPGILFHESRHVMQALVEPFTLTDEKYNQNKTYRQELESYTVQAFFESALALQPTYQPGTEEDNRPTFIKREDGSRIIYSSARMITDLLLEVNKDRCDLFFPDDILIKKIEERGFYI
jgi:hypothetical protein